MAIVIGVASESHLDVTAIAATASPDASVIATASPDASVIATASPDVSVIATASPDVSVIATASPDVSGTATSLLIPAGITAGAAAGTMDGADGDGAVLALASRSAPAVGVG